MWKAKLEIYRKIYRKKFLPPKEEKLFLNEAQKAQTIQGKNDQSDYT